MFSVVVVLVRLHSLLVLFTFVFFIFLHFHFFYEFFFAHPYVQQAGRGGARQQCGSLGLGRRLRRRSQRHCRDQHPRELVCSILLELLRSLAIVDSSCAPDLYHRSQSKRPTLSIVASRLRIPTSGGGVCAARVPVYMAGHERVRHLCVADYHWDQYAGLFRVCLSAGQAGPIVSRRSLPVCALLFRCVASTGSLPEGVEGVDGHGDTST